jgi:hypothetical protein
MTQEEKKPIPDLSREIIAVISLPRITWTDNSFSLVGALNSLNVSTMRGCGAYWDQSLDRLIRRAMTYPAKYILTVDYDTVFNEYHILELYDIMEANPEIDFLFPLQNRRGNKLPMFESFRHQVDKEMEAAVLEVPEEEMNADFFEVDTGHFGLTILRIKSLMKLKRPFFRSIPSEDGDWEAGKTPADTYFWKNAKNAGLKVCLAPQVYIGHLELVCTWPGPADKGWYGVHTMLPEMAMAGHCPAWGRPKSLDRYVYTGIN